MLVYEDNGQLGIDLYTYLYSTIPVDTTIFIPNEQYNIGSIKFKNNNVASVRNVENNFIAINVNGETLYLLSNGLLS